MPFREYPRRHFGPALVLGSAPCLPEDYKAAKKILPHAAVFCVNEATKIVEPDFLASLHYERLDKFNEYAQAAWPAGHWSTHAAIVTERGCTPDQYPMVDYWWPSHWKPAGTSVWFAVAIAKEMGFERILLCGAPMNGGDGYYNTETQDPERFGTMGPGKAYIKSVQETIQMFKADGKAGGVRSMSGFTRETFGGPSWH